MGEAARKLPPIVEQPDEIVDQLAAAMRGMTEHQVDPPVENLFAPGLYARVIHMTAGQVIVSKIHKTEHFCLALSGLAIVRIGDHVETVRGPRLMKTYPGTQRALAILEDAVWITFHPTDLTDVDEIEDQIIAKDHDDPVLVEYRRALGVDRAEGA